MKTVVVATENYCTLIKLTATFLIEAKVPAHNYPVSSFPITLIFDPLYMIKWLGVAVIKST